MDEADFHRLIKATEILWQDTNKRIVELERKVGIALTNNEAHNKRIERLEKALDLSLRRMEAAENG